MLYEDGVYCEWTFGKHFSKCQLQFLTAPPPQFRIYTNATPEHPNRRFYQVFMRKHFKRLQGGRGWLAFGDRSRIPQSFWRARICKFSQQKRCFLQLQENRPFVVVKRLTHTQARKALRKLSESRLHESSLKALRKLSKSSLKAGSTKAL